MSVQETRNELIREYLPKLIRELSGFKDGNERLQALELYAFQQIRNHRYLSTSSHVVRQKIEQIKEKFTVENCAEHAEYFQKLCTEIIEHPLCINHYEVDVQWSLLDLFLSLAYNPAANLRKYKHRYPIPKPVTASTTEATKDENEICKRLLMEDLTPPQEYEYSHDELSDWSDKSSNTEISELTTSPINISTTSIKMPEAEKFYKIFDGKGAKEYLCAHTQHSWWLPGANEKIKIESTLPAANTAVILTQYLKDHTYFTDIPDPSMTTERNLLRELIWMFFMPRTGKFFIVTDEEITLRSNVTIPSVTPNGLASFMKVKFLPYICMMRTLSEFCNLILVQRKGPLTYSHFAHGLSSLLQPIKEKLLEYESRLINQTDFEMNTLIQFEGFMIDSFSHLKCLYKTYNSVVLPYNQHPAHICTLYLLAGLMHCSQSVAVEWETHLIVSLLIKSIEMYCSMLDEWWDDGGFLDQREEFLIEKFSKDNRTSYKLRPLNTDRNISNTIVKSEIFQLLKDHALEVSSTLSLLNDVGRVHELKDTDEAIYNLHETLLTILLKRTRNLQAMLVKEPSASCNPAAEDKVDNVLLDKSVELNKEILKHLTTKDEFLLLAFASKPDIKLLTNVHNVKSAATKAKKKTAELSALDFYNEFNNADAMLSVEPLVKKTLSLLLCRRLTQMNRFVIDLYMNKLKLVEQLQNIRKVLLLEVGDIMLQFCKTLFADIEACKTWASVSYLTRLLSVSMGDSYADIAQAFSVTISSTRRCKTDKVYEAVEELQISYELSPEITAIVTKEDLKIYNEIFRLLLKVKWGLLTLENMRFSKEEKHRQPYASYDFIDLQMRRLQQLRFWMIYSLQCVHNYLMMQILHLESKDLERKLLKCTNLYELQKEHKNYLATIAEKSFLTPRFKAIKLGIDKIFCLIYVLRMEWNSFAYLIKQKSPLAACDDNEEDTFTESLSDAQVDALEQTYVRCHQYLANSLNNEVYTNYNTFVSGLSTAFNSSVPY